MRTYYAIFVSSLAVALSCLLAGWMAEGCSARGDEPGAAAVHVVAVHDGDTATVRFADGRTEHVRLLGIDAPELDQAPWGVTSRDYVAKMIMDKDVIFSTEPTRRDPYGRTLGYLRLADGFTVQERALAAGMAFYFDPGKPLVMTPTLLDAESMARRQGVGVWRPGGPERPWTWRHRRRSGSVRGPGGIASRAVRPSPQSPRGGSP